MQQSDNVSKKPRSRPLGRGKACSNCRHLKIKCDGMRPQCGQCTRIERDDECRYSDSSSGIGATFRATLARLREREMKEPLNTSSPPLSFWSDFQLATISSDNYYQPVNNAPPATTESTSYSLASELVIPLAFPDPPSYVTGTLLNAFLPVSAQFGFCLNASHFQTSTILPMAFSDSSHISNSLINAVYLWGARLSHTEYYESFFFGKALGCLGTDISCYTDMHRVTQVIQAHILIAYYFVSKDRLVEAQYHANGAMSLAIDHRFHKILSSRSPYDERDVADTVRLGERIDIFWATLYLQKCLAVTNDGPVGCGEAFEPADGDIDVPWPLRSCDYEQGFLPMRSQHTVQRMYMSNAINDVTIMTSGPALENMSIVIFHRSVCLSNRWSFDLSQQPEDLQSFLNARRILEHAIWTTMTYAATSPEDLHVTLATLHCASGTLAHTSCKSSNSRASRHTCHKTASAMLTALNDGACSLQPITGTLCVLTARILAPHIAELAATRKACEIMSDEPIMMDDEEAGMLSTMGGIVDFMRPRSIDSGLMARQLKVVDGFMSSFDSKPLSAIPPT